MSRTRPAHARRAAGFTLVELLVVVAILALAAAMATHRLSGVREKARRTAAEHDLATLREAFLAYLGDMRPVPRFTPVNPYVGYEAGDALSLRVHNLFCATNVQDASSEVLSRWAAAGSLPPTNYTRFDAAEGRGWNGPYLSAARAAAYPAPADRRFDGDRTFAERHFVPAFGTPGERALLDPWGNPYVVQFPDPVPAFYDDAPPADGSPRRSFAVLRRFPDARIVSAGPDGILDTPFDRTAGVSADGTVARGDDLVLFLFAPPSPDAR